MTVNRVNVIEEMSGVWLFLVPLLLFLLLLMVIPREPRQFKDKFPLNEEKEEFVFLEKE